MGGAKFMGRDYGMPHSKELSALELSWYWLVGGLPLCFFSSIFIFQSQSFVAPILIYVLGVILLFRRYIKIEREGKGVEEDEGDESQEDNLLNSTTS